MSTDQKLRDHLNPSAARDAGFDSIPEDLWDRIQSRIDGRRHNTATRVAAFAIAAAISITTFLVLVHAFKPGGHHPPAVHPTVPPFQLTISKIQVSDNTGTGEVDGTITNRSDKSMGAQITCEVRTGQGSLLRPFTATVSYVVSGRSATFAAQPPPESGVFPSPSAPDAQATAKCDTAAFLAAPPPPVFHPTQVVFWDSQHGIVTGFLGGQNSSRGAVMVQSTQDGGKTWVTTMQSNLAPNFVETKAFGSGHFWALGRIGDSGTRNLLLQSVDNGRTWSEVTRGRIEDISFTSATDGFVILGPPATATIEQTTDAGRTWKPEPTPPCRRMGLPSLVDLSFVSPTHGWLVCTGAAGAGEAYKAVLETTDGGQTWSTIAHALSASHQVGMSVLGYPAGIDFQPDGTGWMWQQPYRGSSLTSSDGGHTWSDAKIPKWSQSRSWVVSIWSTPDGHVFALSSLGGVKGLEDRTELLTLIGPGRWDVVYAWGP